MRPNPGHFILNAAPCGPEAAIAVTGMGRSGTTMAARILSALGLDLGDVSQQLLEDTAVVAMLKAGDMDAFAAYAAARAAAAPKWAFKCPALRTRLIQADAVLHQPRYVITFRDVVATVSRNSLELDADTIAILADQGAKQNKLIRWLVTLNAPILMLSYEKALAHPPETVARIADFCGIPLDEEQAARIAATEIRPGDPRYLLSEPATPPAPGTNAPGALAAESSQAT